MVRHRQACTGFRVEAPRSQGGRFLARAAKLARSGCRLGEAGELAEPGLSRTYDQDLVRLSERYRFVAGIFRWLPGICRSNEEARRADTRWGQPVVVRRIHRILFEL